MLDIERNLLLEGDIYLVRHGATPWSKTGRHTGRTDLQLDQSGVAAAASLKGLLAAVQFRHVFSSPLQRAMMTCELAGLKARPDPNLLEWDYGAYEGLTKQEIQTREPGWDIYRCGALNGESVGQVVKRCENFLDSVKNLDKPIAVFSHGHFSRALAAVFIGEDIMFAQKIQFDTARVAVLSGQASVGTIVSWNI